MQHHYEPEAPENGNNTAANPSHGADHNGETPQAGQSRREVVNTLNAGLPEYLTTDQTAGLFQVDPRTIQEWARKGYLPVIRIGHTTRYKRSDVESFVAEHFRIARRDTGRRF